MLNVAHVKNDVKWLPIVTKFGTLIGNMSRTGLYDSHIFCTFVDDFKRNSNFGIGVLHVKVKYWHIFVMSFLCSLKFVLFHLIGNTKRCLKKTFSMAQFLWYDCTFNKRHLGLTAPLSNNTLSMIYSPMNTKWPWFDLSMPPKVKCHDVNWKTIYRIWFTMCSWKII